MKSALINKLDCVFVINLSNVKHSADNRIYHIESGRIVYKSTYFYFKIKTGPSYTQLNFGWHPLSTI